MAKTPQFIKEIKIQLKINDQESISNIGYGYDLLVQHMRKNIIPLLQENQITIAVVELTTCGLLSDLFTCEPGSSVFFKMGICPYSTEMKLEFGVPSTILNHDGPGTVSPEAAEFLAKKVKESANAFLGIAETGMLPTDFSGKKTAKRAGEVYLAIHTDQKSLSTSLDVQKGLSRLLMRQAITWEILKLLHEFIITLIASNKDFIK
ncbi:MAG: CinA family protein [Candidatus Hodarchaeales archaeon]